MPTRFEPTLYDIECVAFAAAAVGFGLYFMLAALRRSRPELSIGQPMAVAVTLRVAAATGVSLLGAASSLRGGDERFFLELGRDLAHQPLGSEASLSALTSQLHTWLFSLQIRLFDFPDTAIRVTHVGIAVAGLLLLAVAVHDLAGPRAARLTAWLLAVEPASIFFSGVLHKESLMIFGGGLVAYGGARLWSDRDFLGLVPMAAGCAVAVATRPYAGWFLVAAAMAIALHASLTRHGERQVPALGLAALVAFLIALSLPTVLEQSSNEKLQDLQVSQDANAKNAEANLSLEQVDYSTRANVIVNLPGRVRDVLFRPYLWQVENTSQQLGVLGTLVTLAVLFFLVQAVARSPRDVMTRAGPIVYPALFLLIAYSLSAGNAGTGFRYRTHLVVLAISLVVILRYRLAEAPARAAPMAPAPAALPPTPELARPR
jgi:dolichyl-phosphate-mannose-protein mannosyltransferase